MYLRRYQPKDLEMLYRVFYEAVRATKHYSESQKSAWAPSAPPKSFYESLEEDFTLLACEGESLIGYIQLRADGLLHAIYTHPDFQGRGVGRFLMHSAIKEAKRLGLKRIYLEASQNARDFYKKMGFIVTKERPKMCRGEIFTISIMEMDILSSS